MKKLIEFITEIANDVDDRVSPSLKNRAKELLNEINFQALDESENVIDNEDEKKDYVCKKITKEECSLYDDCNGCPAADNINQDII